MFWAAYYFKKIELTCGRNTYLLDSTLLSPFRTQLGGNLRLMLSGGAPISKDVHWFMRVCFCSTVIQAYGLTETCGAGTWLPIDDVATESVGAPLPCVEVKLVDVPEMKYTSHNKPRPQGEVWIRGPAVSPGYFKNEKLTKESFSEDSWFASGDIGEWYPDGTLAIIDRKKNLVKLASGEYLAVENIESKYKNNRYVSNILVHGTGQLSNPIALIVPKSKESKEIVLQSLLQTGKEANLQSFEMLKDIYLCEEEWTTSNGMLTAAMKLQRHNILKNYKHQIDEMIAIAESSY